MSKILILGSGLVSRPGVEYLLKEGFDITVASNEPDKAEALVKSWSNGKACPLDVTDDNALEKLIREHDIAVSLLPWIFHVKVAKLCIKHKKNMATASYISPEMQSLETEVREKGLLILNEIGVDPGIDHMSAMKVIDEVHMKGGKVKKFYSFCGGFPAAEANDNPFGYKFSWSPRGVILASGNSAKFLEDGKIVNIDGKDLFDSYRVEEVDDLGEFEVYPNRDSVPYKDIYGLKDADTVMRGTYRYPGWCRTLKKIVDLGLTDDKRADSLKNKSLVNMMRYVLGISESENVVEKVAEKLDISADDPVISRLEWLGLFSEESSGDFDSPLDILSNRMETMMPYKDNERDMLLMRHKFIVEYPDNTKETIYSTLEDYGIPGGDSSMARTVSLPLAIGVKLMAKGRIAETGVIRPVKRELYMEILSELETLGIKMKEEVR